MDLVEFLLARIAEDEAAARAASGILGMAVAWHQPDVLHQRGINRADSQHIARWDPARVLAECDAKRQLIALGEKDSYWDDVLRVVALSYADHTDYQPEWRP